MQADSIILGAEKSILDSTNSTVMEEEDEGQLTDILPGFPEKVEGEIVFCDADNSNTDGSNPANTHTTTPYPWRKGRSIHGKL